MDSTGASTSGIPTEVHIEIDKLFSWNPPELELRLEPNSKSTGTRGPSFYDKHFKKDFILRKVEHISSLLTQLTENVQNLVEETPNLPGLRGLITAEQREGDISNLNTIMRDENEVALFYQMTTVTYCSRVASTLALHPTSESWRGGLLCWSTQIGPHKDYAIVDGWLCFMQCPKNEDDPNEIARKANVERMDPETRLIFEEMRKNRSSLATWEIKSITSGPCEVMTAARDFGNFSWVYCDAPDCLVNVQGSKHEKARTDVDEAIVGPDALNPPWKLPKNSSNTSETPDIDPLRAREPDSSKIASSTDSAKNKGKKRKQPDDDLDYEPEYWHHDSAKKILQQAWAQAVRVDGTLIVLHSGNYELVCVRHRGSQTLYVSDLIEPHNFYGYGKLHVGIYIAAIQETIDRKRQLKIKLPGHGDNSTGGEDDNQKDHNGGSGSHHDGGGKHHGGCRRGRGRGGSRSQGSARRLGSTDELVVKAIDLANKYNTVLLYFRYGVYDSPIPASFFRSAPSIAADKHPPFPPQHIQLEECITIVLTSEIGFGSTGMVHRGNLTTCQPDGATSLDIAVKLALDIEQRDALRNEYKIYRYLRSKGVLRGIATALGLFDDSEDSACALVTTYAGIPVSTELQGDLSVSDCKSALSTLKFIHRAGILHGDIRRDNILIGDFGITIIDFSHSEQSANQKAKDRELSELCCLLGLADKE